MPKGIGYGRHRANTADGVENRSNNRVNTGDGVVTRPPKRKRKKKGTSIIDNAFSRDFKSKNKVR